MATKYLFALICCFIVFNSIQGGLVDFSDCGSEYELISVDIDGCNKYPCPMENYKSYKVTIRFKPKFKSSILTQYVYVKAWDVEIKLAVSPDNPCSALVCPVNVSDGTKFVGTLTLNKYIFPTKADLWWRMETENKKKAICMKTRIEIIQ